MPEGHVIHGLARELNRRFRGLEVEVSSPQGRFAEEAKFLNKRIMKLAQAYGKHLFITFEDPEPATIHIHLGLIGKMWIRQAADVVGKIRLRITDHIYTADLAGPQWCNLVDSEFMLRVISQSGADPLRQDADSDMAWDIIHKSPRAICDLLLDQKIVAGVGNIYRAEVLFRNRLDPMCPGNTLTYHIWEKLWSDLVYLMDYGVNTGRIDTVFDEHMPEMMGRPPRIDPHGGEVYVYRRANQDCYVCGTKVSLKEFHGRNLFWCATCQRADY